jgi:hypothetical protein
VSTEACTIHHYHSTIQGMVCCGCEKTMKPSNIRERTPRTQKAKGLRTLVMQGQTGGNHYTTHLIQDEEDVDVVFSSIAGATQKLSTPFFARPCPIIPRHGFVESRPVSTREEVKQAYLEAKAADEKAELILMPLIDASLNAIYTPGVLAVGPGHDGATGGKGSVSFPLIGIPQGGPALLKDAGVKESPYVEVVYAKPSEQAMVTQIRSGPASSGGVDFIPATTKVVAVTIPCDDLLEWEEQVKGMEEGTVVYGAGHTLASHAAVHCVAKGIPFITSFKPKVGQVVEKVVTEPWSLEALKEGIGLAAAWNPGPVDSTKGANEMVRLILYGVHQAPAMQGADAKWLGFAAGAMFRLGLAAGLGEWRHRQWPVPRKPYARSQIYNFVLNPTKGWLQYRKRLHRITRGYFVLPWAGSMGGIRWGQCTFSLYALDRGIQDVLRAKTAAQGQAAALRMLAALNAAVDQAHNGGWWLNKFGANQSQFTAASNGIWDYTIAPVLYRMEQVFAEKQTEAAKAAAEWADLERMPKLPPFRFRDKEVIVGAPGATVLHYRQAGRTDPTASAVHPKDTLPAGKHKTVKVQRKWDGKNLTFSFFCKGISLERSVTYRLVR